MNERDFVDLGRLMDDIFAAAESFRSKFTDNVENVGERAKRYAKEWPWNEERDFYSFYSFPPANIYMSPERSITFEFALAGFNEKDIDLEFKGDYMILNARAPETPESVSYLKRRLKFKDVVDQKYYVPDDKFDREQAKAVFKNGMLKVTVPARDDIQAKQGIKIEIIDEDEGEKGSSSSSSKEKK
ncbi:MAG: Hsp20/alpha crystallin family protein [Alkalispirochaetaceae bacterium]